MKLLSGGSKGGAPARVLPKDQNFLNFMQFFGKIWQICMLAPPPEGLAPPPHEKFWIRPCYYTQVHSGVTF